jgi:ribose transport system ATP-binding protein
MMTPMRRSLRKPMIFWMSMTAIAKSEIYKLLNTLATQGKAIIVISSELPEVLLLSHRILVMCEGRITGEVRGDLATQEGLMQLATQREALAA